MSSARRSAPGAQQNAAEGYPPVSRREPEPTRQRANGLGVIFITHNVRHAYAVGNSFTVLNRGKTLGTYEKAQIGIEELQNLMAGDKELQLLSDDLGGMV